MTTANPLPFAAGTVTATVNGFAAPLLYVSPTQFNIQVPYEVGAGPAVVGINNNGRVAGYQINLSPSAPAIYTDGHGNLAGNPSPLPGGLASLYFNGAGDETPQLPTGSYSPSASTLLLPLQPVSITVGGQPAFIQWLGVAPLDISTAQINFYVPAGLEPGPQPVVVTVGGQSSPPVDVTVTAPPPPPSTSSLKGGGR